MSGPLLFSYVSDTWKEVLILVLTLVFLVFAYFKYKFTYWQRRGFPAISGSIPGGSLNDFILARKSIGEVVLEVYKKCEGKKYLGYYALWTPTLMIRDMELVRRVLVKDSDCFVNRGMYYNDKDDPLSAHLFALDGVKWKSTRSKLNPMFSNSKIKMMYITMKVCALQLQDYLRETVSKNDVIDFKYVSARHSVNVIANTAVGIEGHSLKNESHLSEMTFKVTEPTLVQGFRFVLAMLGKDFAKLVKMRFTPKDVEDYYLDLTKKIVNYRSQNNVVRNDFMHLLMEMWDKSTSYEMPTKPDDETTLSLRDLAAQTFIFIVAAYETTASTMCFTLYELAMNPEIQEKARAEVDAAGSPEDITYEQMLELKYIEYVLNETMRKYPPGAYLFRECLADYQLPDGKILEKGTTVTISTLGMQNDPELFPNPEKFDPDRFNKEKPAHEVQPFTWMPFGEGPRYCIGKRYAIIQMKLTLFTLLSNFRFEIANKTKVPPKIDPKTFVTHAEGGMFLKIVRRKKD